MSQPEAPLRADPARPALRIGSVDRVRETRRETATVAVSLRRGRKAAAVTARRCDLRRLSYPE